MRHALIALAALTAGSALASSSIALNPQPLPPGRYLPNQDKATLAEPPDQAVGAEPAVTKTFGFHRERHRTHCGRDGVTAIGVLKQRLELLTNGFIPNGGQNPRSFLLRQVTKTFKMTLEQRPLFVRHIFVRLTLAVSNSSATGDISKQVMLRILAL